MDPGEAEPLWRDFETERRGDASVGASTSSQLTLPWAEAQAVLEMTVASAGRGSSTTTAKARLAEAPPPASVPIERVQDEPAEELGVHVQPGELAPEEKTVYVGTVSESTTAEAAWLPPLVTVRA